MRAEQGAAGAPELKLVALARERDALKGELKRCEARLRQLEEAQAEVRERIAWALDALRNILARG